MNVLLLSNMQKSLLFLAKKKIVCGKVPLEIKAITDISITDS